MSKETTWLQNIKALENSMVDWMARKIKESNARIIWNIGLGDGSGLLGFLQRMSEKAVGKLANFDHVIRISIPSISDGYSFRESNEGTDEIRKKTVMVIAKELGIMDEDNTTLTNLKKELEEQAYYTYKVDEEKEFELVRQMENLIYEKLASKEYLLIIENIVQPLVDPKIIWLLESWVVPLPSRMNKSYWIVSTTSMDAYIRSKRETKVFLSHHIFELSELIEDYWQWTPSAIIEVELFHVAKSISTNDARTLVRTIDVLWSCLLYSQLFSLEHEKSREEESWPYYIQQKELLNFWISEGFFSQTVKLAHLKTQDPKDSIDTLLALDDEEEEEEEEEQYPNPCSLREGEIILQVLLSHSLLRTINSSSSYPISSSDASMLSFSGMWQLLVQWKEDITGSSIIPAKYKSWVKNRWELIEPNSYKEWVNISWISFLGNTGLGIIQPKPNPTTTFILRRPTDMSKFSLETLFPQMRQLRVLDLSYTSIELLPASLSKMTDLRLLSLRGCSRLKTLISHSSSNSASSSLGPLELLEFLDFRGVSLDTIPDDLEKSKYKLRYLDLSSPTITSLPTNLFQHMPNLRELFFLGCTSLGSLPPSLTNLHNLEIFSLSESQIFSLPNETFERMPKLHALNLVNNQLLRSLPTLAGHASLKSFNLSGSPITCLSLHACRSLETVCLHDLDRLEELDLSATAIKPLNLKNNLSLRSLPTLAGNASLKSFSLLGAPITHLSLHSCRSLETVCLQDLDRLEELDLSATAIKEFPGEVSNLRKLRRLYLLAVPQLRRIPWNKLDRLPEVFILDQCEHEFTVQSNVAESSHLLKDGVGARIFLTDSRLLSSFTYKDCKHLVEEGGSLQSFYISVTPCDKELAHPDQFQNKKPSCFEDLPLIESTFKQQFLQNPLNRHVEISSAQRYSDGLEGILQIVESLTVRDDAYVSSLTDLNPKFPKLQECKLKRCHLIEVIFRVNKLFQGDMLQTLWVSNLPKMTKVIGGGFVSSEFGVLKHVHIHQCAKLESIFPGDLMLRSLETVSVLDCPRLRSVFYGDAPYDKNYFPKLHTIQLHELPQLLHLYKNQQKPLRMPEWKEFHFRGCWNLRRLPLLVGPRDPKVRVDGEARQCKELKARMGEEQLSCYDFRSPPPPASFREGVKNRIFLK